MLDNYHSRSMKVTHAVTERRTYLQRNDRPSTRHLKEHCMGKSLC